MTQEYKKTKKKGPKALCKTGEGVGLNQPSNPMI